MKSSPRKLAYQKNYRNKNRKRLNALALAYYYKNKQKYKKYKKEYYQKNKTKLDKRNAKWNRKNKIKRRELTKKWNDQHPGYIRAYQRTENFKIKRRSYQRTENFKIKRRLRTKIRRQNDPSFRLNCNMSSAISNSLKGDKNGQCWEALVGYTLDELRCHLEKTFDENMSWENYGSYWSVDHIKPKTAFCYTDTNSISFKKCWSLDNLQALEKITNIKKSNKLFN